MNAPSRKQLGWLGGLAVVAGVLLAAPDAPENTREPVQARAAVARPVASAVPRVDLEKLPQASQAVAPEVRDVFVATSWFVPPPPPLKAALVKPLPPPPPSAPPLPFSYLGRYLEDGKLTLMLVRGDRIYTVSEGEVIDNTYRIGAVSGSLLELTYLPLNIKQTLNVGTS
jgi:hypothetical protein